MTLSIVISRLLNELLDSSKDGFGSGQGLSGFLLAKQRPGQATAEFVSIIRLHVELRTQRLPHFGYLLHVFLPARRNLLAGNEFQQYARGIVRFWNR